MKNIIIQFASYLILIIFTSCNISSKETTIGKNIYLSEYDKVDRRIIYKDKESTSVLELVPMTVLEIAHNERWIIAKSKSTNHKHSKYWIIKKDMSDEFKVQTIKNSIDGPLSFDDFKNELIDKSIKLKLQKINE